MINHILRYLAHSPDISLQKRRFEFVEFLQKCSYRRIRHETRIQFQMLRRPPHQRILELRQFACSAISPNVSMIIPRVHTKPTLQSPGIDLFRYTTVITRLRRRPRAATRRGNPQKLPRLGINEFIKMLSQFLLRHDRQPFKPTLLSNVANLKPLRAIKPRIKGRVFHRPANNGLPRRFLPRHEFVKRQPFTSHQFRKPCERLRMIPPPFKLIKIFLRPHLNIISFSSALDTYLSRKNVMNTLSPAQVINRETQIAKAGCDCLFRSLCYQIRHNSRRRP